MMLPRQTIAADRQGAACPHVPALVVCLHFFSAHLRFGRACCARLLQQTAKESLAKELPSLLSPGGMCVSGILTDLFKVDLLSRPIMQPIRLRHTVVRIAEHADHATLALQLSAPPLTALVLSCVASSSNLPRFLHLPPPRLLNALSVMPL